MSVLIHKWNLFFFVVFFFLFNTKAEREREGVKKEFIDKIGNNNSYKISHFKVFTVNIVPFIDYGIDNKTEIYYKKRSIVIIKRGHKMCKNKNMSYFVVLVPLLFSYFLFLLLRNFLLSKMSSSLF